MASKSSAPVKAAQMATITLLVFGLSLFGPNQNLLGPSGIQARLPAPIPLKATLVAWISSQSESIVEEMEAIVKQQVETNQFSVVLYLRFLNLFDKLEVVARQDFVDEFGWIAKKIKAYRRVHGSVHGMVAIYLRDLDDKMSKIETGEMNGKQVAVSKPWVELYETINYIATHAPERSSLVTEATEVMTKSPTGTPDKKRATRYLLHRRAFH